LIIILKDKYPVILLEALFHEARLRLRFTKLEIRCQAFPHFPAKIYADGQKLHFSIGYQ
jgi:hypothetical protein